MTDTIHQGETWRRTVTISNGVDPIDPTDLTAVMCPETRLAIAQLGPGSYEVSLTEDETAALWPGATHWELWGRLGADLSRLAGQPVTVVESCGP